MLNTIFYVILEKKIYIGELIYAFLEDKMSKERFSLAVIDPTVNQRLAAEYEGVIRCFLDVKKDNKIFDEYFDASKSEYVAGTQKGIEARLDLQRQLAVDNFEQYKKARLTEIQRLLKDKRLSEKRCEDLAYEARLLEVSSSYNAFGRNMRNFGDFEFNIYIPDDVNDDHKNNRNQLKTVEKEIRDLINRRYEMMQSLSFSMSNGDKIPTSDVKVDDYFDQILIGLDNYRSNKKTKSFVDDIYDRDYDLFNQQLEYEQIGIPVARMKGMTQTYQDAVQALVSSPMFKPMCSYYMTKAIKEKDQLGKIRWRDGDYQQIINYAYKKGLISELDAETHRKRHDMLFGKAILGKRLMDDLNTFEQLEKAQKEYNFMVQMVNEFSQARQKDPNLLKSLEEISPMEQTVKLNMNTSDLTTSMNKRLVGVANLLVQENTVSQAIWEGGKEAIIGAVFLGSGGLASFVGWGLTAVNVGSLMHPTTAKWQKDIQQKWFNDTGLNRWLADVKNKPLVESLTKTINEELEIAGKRREKIEKLGLNENFDEMIEFGLNNTSVTQHEILKLIKQARRMEKLPKEEFEKIERENASKLEEMNEQLAKNPNDFALNIQKKNIFKQTALIKMAKTGNYFYYAQLTQNMLNEFANSISESQIRKYSGTGAEILRNFNDAMEMRISAEVELENRQILSKAWNDAGRPSMKSMRQASIFKTEEEKYLEFEERTNKIFEEARRRLGNQTLKENSQQIGSLAHNESQFTNFNNNQNA